MNDNFNIEAFRFKVKSVLENKSLINTHDYTAQLENLLSEVIEGNTPSSLHPDLSEIQGLLEKARSRVNSLFYNAPVGYCVINADGHIITSNNAFCRLLQMDQSLIDGHDIRDYIHQDSIELVNFQINKIISSKTTLSTNLLFFRGGKEIIIRFQTTYYIEGEHEYLQCIATDISDTKAIENELAASEAQFRNLLEASPLGILVIHKGKYFYSNKAAASIFGFTEPDDLIGRYAIDTIAEESRPDFKERILGLDNDKASEPFESIIICNDKQHKVCETASIPVIFDNRLSTLLIISDISIRKNDEKLILESQQKYKEMYQLLRLMCDNVPDMIWAKNLNNEYTFINKAASKVLLNAADTDEPIGKTGMFFAQRESNKHPDDLKWHTLGETCRDSDIRIIENNTPMQFTESGFAGGRYLHLDVYKSPLYDETGKTIGKVGSARNITNEHQLQSENNKMLETLTLQSARLNAVISVLPDLLFIININGDFIDFFASDPTKLAADPEHIKGININQLFTPDEVSRQLEIYRKCIETKSIQSFEYNIILNDVKFYYEARIAPLSENSILAIVRDISEKKQSEAQIQNYTKELLLAKEKAEKNDKLKSAFIDCIHHEIRTPMNSIIGYADMLKTDGLSFDKRKEYTEIIINRSTNLQQTINNILDISDIESGNAHLNTTSCDLNSLLNQLYSSFKSSLKLKSDAELLFTCEKGIKTGHLNFQIDELKLKQIFVNLIDNAFKFTDKGIITFGFKRPQNGMITCFVSDTGIGIDPSRQDSIFEHYNQVNSLTNTNKSSGLGLWICKGFVELMGGRIWVESNPGGGSIFFFQLPFIQYDDKGNKIDPKKVIAGYNWENKNIVIVEDDEQNLKFLQIVLSRTKATIYHAVDSVSFRKLFNEIPDIHIILMDIQLPIEDGLQLTQYVKSIRKDIPVIAQTAYEMDSYKAKCEQAGCDNYISKPISSENLLEILAAYLD